MGRVNIGWAIVRIRQWRVEIQLNNGRSCECRWCMRAREEVVELERELLAYILLN